MKYWLFQNNQVCGPYDPEELGRLPGYSLESFVCPEGKGSSMGDWRLASLIPELAPAAEQKAAQAPAFSPEDISLLNALQEKVALLESTAIQVQDSLGALERIQLGDQGLAFAARGPHRRSRQLQQVSLFAYQ